MTFGPDYEWCNWTSRYSEYLVCNSIRNSLKSKPPPPRVANCCIVACRIPRFQSSRDSRDEFIVKKISARDSSNALVVPQSAENKIAYSTHFCRFPSFERYAFKQVGTRRTVERAVVLPAPKLLSRNVTAIVHESIAEPQTTAVICTRDSAASCIVPRTESYSALDLTSTRPVSFEKIR